jgi:hypothetical protein
MKLIDAINSYVTLQQSKGMSFGLVSRILGRFSRNMGDLRIDEVRPQAVADFLQGTRPLSATWLLKYRVLSSFYRFAIDPPHDGGSLASSWSRHQHDSRVVGTRLARHHTYLCRSRFGDEGQGPRQPRYLKPPTTATLLRGIPLANGLPERTVGSLIMCGKRCHQPPWSRLVGGAAT